jgi:hypothetical protein
MTASGPAWSVFDVPLNVAVKFGPAYDAIENIVTPGPGTTFYRFLRRATRAHDPSTPYCIGSRSAAQRYANGNGRFFLRRSPS